MELLSESVIFYYSVQVRFSTTEHLLAFNDGKMEGFSSLSTCSIRAIGQDLKTKGSHTVATFSKSFLMPSTSIRMFLILLTQQ